MLVLLIVLCNVLLLVTGQTMWKYSLNRHPLKSPSDLIALFTDPVMLGGCLLFGVATIVWFYALSRYDLSRIYPLQSMAYVLGALSGVILFKETMSGGQWLGVILILGGALLVAKP